MPPFLESPRCLSAFQGSLFPRHCLDFQTEDRLTPRWHVGHHCGKASWENLVGKRRGKASWKASRESHRSLDSREGKLNTAATARRKAHVHAPTRDEDLLPWGDSRSAPRYMSAMERNPQVLAQTPHKILGPSIDGRGNPRGPRKAPEQLARGLSFHEATRAGP